HAHAQRAARARVTGLRHPIDDAVAVVVEAVARLGLRPDGARAREHAVGAHRETGRALAERDAAGLVRVHGVVVDGAVAVVVDAVARLHGGYADLANAALVDEAVAVVVEPVAHLGARRLARVGDEAGGAVARRVAHAHAGALAHALLAV